jgi:hypothetical protein
MLSASIDSISRKFCFAKANIGGCTGIYYVELEEGREGERERERSKKEAAGKDKERERSAMDNYNQ